VERIYRDVRLVSIRTGTGDVMSMIIAHKEYPEYARAKAKQQ
jgi:butyryl-CoA dehydrogenase